MSTDLLVAPVPSRHRAPEPPKPKPKPKKKRRRRRFSLNGLAIQLSAFALSFTLVALLVVSGSQAAFVEENEAVTNYVPIGTTAPPEDDDPDRSPRSPSPSPSPSAPAPTTPPPAEEPQPEEVPSTVVELADSDAGTAMFGQEVTLAPGVASDRCIEVAYDGNVDPQPVQLYAAIATGDLSPYLDLTIEIGDAATGAFGNCDTFVASSALYQGTLADFAARHDSWSTGVTTWDPGPDPEARTFRFTVSVQDDPVAEGRSVVFGFSWETRETE